MLSQSAEKAVPDQTDADVRGVAAEILRYLRVHPNAADTIEGAARWWLSRQPQIETVEKAMTLLVLDRLVEKHTLAEGTTVFRSAPRRERLRNVTKD